MVRGIKFLVSIILLLTGILSGSSLQGQCIAAQSSYLVPGCGNTEMVLNASQGGVSYELINQRTGVRVGGNNGQGNGGSVSVGIATSTDIYFVRAKTAACPDSIEFGHRMITVLPAPQMQQLIGPKFACLGSAGGPVPITLSGSEIGVNYELFSGAGSQGIYPGTGSSIHLGYFGPGIYTMTATRTGSVCSGVEFNYHEISDRRSLPFFEGFNTNQTTYDLCWTEFPESGSASLEFRSSSTNPPISPYEGSHFMYWNSANPAWTNMRNKLWAGISTTGVNNVEVQFYWYNNNNPSFSTGNYLLEGVQVQYSLDGTNWVNAGPLITRHDNTLPSGTGQWKKKTVSLPPQAGNQFFVYLGFSFRAFGGNNCGLDAITVKAAGTCAEPFNIQARDINHNSAKIEYGGTGSYIIEYGAPGFVPGTAGTPGPGGTIILANNSPVLISGLNSSTLYDVYVRQDCGAGQYSTNSFRNSFSTACTPTTLPYRQNFDDVSAANPTCIRIQDLDKDSYSWIINSFGTYYSQPNSLSMAFWYNSDDWFFTQGINLAAGSPYRLRFKYRTGGSVHNFQVKLGVTADSISMQPATLFNANNFNASTFQQVDLSFTPAASGVYYLGFHGFGTGPNSYLYIDDIAIDVPPPCPSDVSNITAGTITGNSANFTWNNISTGYQYAITSLQAPPGSGTFTNTPSANITGLNGTSKYYFHVRAQCSPGVFGNWSSFAFYTAPDCASAEQIQICSEVQASIPAGNGFWNFSGTYPNNSLGQNTPGKEKLFRFTVTESGVYYLDITKAESFDKVDYFYKKISEGCSNTGWTPIFAHSYYSRNGKYALGLLEAGAEYALLLDAEATNAIVHSFKICKATVNQSSVQNTCVPVGLPIGIPANSTKIEYLIDFTGNLIASLDFSSASTGSSGVGGYYNDHTGPTRSYRNIEYLDRNFSISTGTSGVKVKLYFRNSDLQKLINEPNDGFADIGTISDLRVTQASIQCESFGEESEENILTVPTLSGAFGTDASFVEFKVIRSAFYLHGGAQPVFSKLVEKKQCPGPATFSFFSYLEGATAYQWQVDTGTGFVNLSNDAIHFGTNNFYLELTNPPLNFGGNKYRCLITRGSEVHYTYYSILKFQTEWYGSTQDWHDPNNWYCGVVPNEFTDVLIDINTSYSNPVISANAYCRSLTITVDRSVTVNSGFKLEIKGKPNQ